MMGFLSSHLCQRPNGLGGQETSPSTPIYSGEAHGSFTRSSGVALPSPKSSSSPAVLGEALQDCHAPPPPPRRCAAAGWSLPQPPPLSLLDKGSVCMVLVFHELCSMLFILATFTSRGICVCNPPLDVDDDELYRKRKIVVIISPVDIVDNCGKIIEKKQLLNLDVSRGRELIRLSENAKKVSPFLIMTFQRHFSLI